MKLIIDTDPGIDDAMAILGAFNCPDVEVIALTSLFGNVTTETATLNALKLLEVAGKEEKRVASFVHGKDGFGNTDQQPPKGTPVSQSASELIVQLVNENPGEVAVLLLASATNLALALQQDLTIAGKWKQVVILGGAFFTNGNVNPAAEANVFGDPEAMDYVLMHGGPNVAVVGLDVTHTVQMTAADLEGLSGRGRFGSFIRSISQFYLQYHRDTWEMDGMHLHDPTALLALLRPELFTWKRGAALTVLVGPARGATIMDAGFKRWSDNHSWKERPAVQVAVGAQSESVREAVMELLSK